MLTIVQRGGATREKPPEVVRGQASRLPWAWSGLCFAVPFNDATRDSARDLVASAAVSEWASSPTFTKDNRGNVAALTTTSSYFGYPENPAHNKPSTAVTAYVRLRRNGTAVAGTGATVCKVHTQGVDPWRVWSTQVADSDAAKLGASITIGGVNLYWENSYVTDTSTWMSVFLRWSSGTAPQQDILGERGQTYSTATYGSTVSGTLTYNTTTPQPIRIAQGDNTGNSAYPAAYSQVLAWSRRLTDTEMQALVADPYGWYSPRRETIGVSSPYPLFGGESFMREISSG